MPPTLVIFEGGVADHGDANALKRGLHELNRVIEREGQQT
jgi:hypothetical protein